MSVHRTLASFDISKKTGFLPETPPLTSLPTYFGEWNKVLSQVSDLLRNHQLRDAVHDLPVREFSERTLHSAEEWRMALLMLTSLFQGYLWQEGEVGVPSKIPSILAVPLSAVSKKIGSPPIATYASTVLYNWHLRNSEEAITIENLQSTVNFTGKEDESWFFMIHVTIELKAAPAVEAVWTGMQATKEKNNALLVKCLAKIEGSLVEMKLVLNRMSEGCDPKTFYVAIRSYLAGTKGIATVPNGVIYEGVESEPKQYHGASGTGSTTIRAIDYFLGIEHAEENVTVFESLIAYMPLNHAQFLKYIVSEQVSLRKYVADSHDGELIKQFNATIEALVAFRNSHFVVVIRFIANQREHTNVAPSLEETGTGGTTYMDFLKAVRDKTREAIIQE